MHTQEHHPNGQIAKNRFPNLGDYSYKSYRLVCHLQSCRHQQPSIALQVQDRIGFLINNLTNSNLKQKVNELKEHLTEEYWPWFCNYMVVKRAAQEQNYHLLYVNLLQELQVQIATKRYN